MTTEEVIMKALVIVLIIIFGWLLGCFMDYNNISSAYIYVVGYFTGLIVGIIDL